MDRSVERRLKVRAGLCTQYKCREPHCGRTTLCEAHQAKRDENELRCRELRRRSNRLPMKLTR